MKNLNNQQRKIGLGILAVLALLSFTLNPRSSSMEPSTFLHPSSALAQEPLAPGQNIYLPFIKDPPGLTAGYSVVFVSRQIPPNGSLYYSETGSQPGVGPYSRFTVAAPGKLMVRGPKGALSVLVDGSNPQPSSFNLIDVDAPDVSYDGTQIVFAGLPNGSYQSVKLDNPGAWRLFVINVDGTGLRQLTFSDRDNLDLSQFNNQSVWKKYDDTDPAWLPDGRVVFASTRWPSIGMYVDARTTNLYVVNADGTGMHRITAERNGADRPIVDPVTGKIVYARWWRNFRNGTNNMGTILDPRGGYKQYLGLVAESLSVPLGSVPGADLVRNSWMLATINPDGTDLAQWGGVSGISYASFDNQAYGGSFTPSGVFYANFFPMYNLGEAAGFGGIRIYQRGPSKYKSFMGITDESQPLARQNPPSYHVFQGTYVTEPEYMPNGKLIVSLAKDVRQDYGLYVVDSDGTHLTPLYDNPGTTELRSRLIRPRPIPPIIPDQVTQVASLLPPLAGGPYDIDGTFLFNALNVYFNAPVDTYIDNAIAVGSAGTIRFFIDHQRSPGGGFAEYYDWPILLQEVAVNPDGSVSASAPANVPLFEQIRSPKPGYTIPLTLTSDGQFNQGAAHVAGLNFGRTGVTQNCVGCHAGHSMIPVPANLADAKWTNLATGATVTYSSINSNINNNGRGLIDRRVNLGGGNNRYWYSQAGLAPTSQWVQLTFPVPVTVRTVRLYNLPSYLQVSVKNATVRLYSDAAATQEIINAASGQLAGSGTNIGFSEVKVRAIRIQFTSVTGNLAGLAEVEVIARAEAGP